MNPISIALFTVLILSSVIILYQDFKERLVSLWVILVFGGNVIASVIYFRDLKIILYNGLSIVLYASFIWLTLKLYLYLKFKKNKVIINQQLGSADVLVILFIGLTFNIVGMIFFFSFAFVLSLVSFILFSLIKKNSDSQNIPLAGLLVFFYIVVIIILNLIQFNPLIDCSFVNL